MAMGSFCVPQLLICHESLLNSLTFHRDLFVLITG